MNALIKPQPITIARERYSDELIREMTPLLEMQWKEIANYQDQIPLDPDFSVYQRLDAAEKMLWLIARHAGVLIGYSGFILSYPPHYKSTLFAKNDVIYVPPGYRRSSTGLRLIRESERQLKEIAAGKIIKVSWHVKTSNHLQGLLTALGYAVDEVSMGKIL
jgi:hypothetical protein